MRLGRRPEAGLFLRLTKPAVLTTMVDHAETFSEPKTFLVGDSLGKRWEREREEKRY